jgi:hypothetical protein
MAKHEACMLVKKPERKRTPGRPWHELEDNNKSILKKQDRMGWTQLICTPVNMVKKLQVP